MKREPGKNWLTTQQAAHFLSTAMNRMYTDRDLRAALTTQTCRAYRSRGPRLWYRPDMAELLRIKRECGATLPVAARTMKAMREGRLWPKPEGAA